MLSLGQIMTRRPDWKALIRLFDQSGRSGQLPAPSAFEDEFVTYQGKSVPKWLARDLAQERTAIMEFDGGLTREEAEAEVRKSLN